MGVVWILEFEVLIIRSTQGTFLTLTSKLLRKKRSLVLCSDCVVTKLTTGSPNSSLRQGWNVEPTAGVEDGAIMNRMMLFSALPNLVEVDPLPEIGWIKQVHPQACLKFTWGLLPCHSCRRPSSDAAARFQASQAPEPQTKINVYSLPIINLVFCYISGRKSSCS